MNLPNCKTPYSSCPFLKDTLKGWVGSERMKGILDEESFLCHKKNHLQCAGHMLIKGNENGFVRLANILKHDLILFGREKIFETENDCIEHHNNQRRIS